MKEKGIMVVHGEKQHRYGDPCVDCYKVFLENPYVKRILNREHEKICRLIDKIESSCGNTSMEEWKMFKRIRNAIRDLDLVDIGKVNVNQKPS